MRKYLDAYHYHMIYILTNYQTLIKVSSVRSVLGNSAQEILDVELINFMLCTKKLSAIHLATHYIEVQDVSFHNMLNERLLHSQQVICQLITAHRDIPCDILLLQYLPDTLYGA